MKLTSLCYIERENRYLMLYRNKKENDENGGKWVGIGGSFEAGESPEDCVLREIKEETSLDAKSLSFRGIITFVSDKYGTEYMHLFTCRDFDGEVTDCDEGELQWIEKDKVPELNLWQGDRIFLSLIRDEKRPFFSLKLIYEGDTLTDAFLNGEKLDIDALLKKTNAEKDNVVLYTDGSCKCNPGPGGWAAIAVCKGKELVLSGGEAETTNNRMELKAAIEGLKALKKKCTVMLVSDSKYLCDAVSKGWAVSWKANGWIKKDKSPALNPDLWEELLSLLDRHDVTLDWVKGHAGHEYNERCDTLAQAEAEKFR